MHKMGESVAYHMPFCYNNDTNEMFNLKCHTKLLTTWRISLSKQNQCKHKFKLPYISEENVIYAHMHTTFMYMHIPHVQLYYR